MMQHFYLLLLNADMEKCTSSSSSSSSDRSLCNTTSGLRSNLSELIQAINRLEDALLFADVTDEQLTDPSFAAEEVTLEIVRDCQRKGAAAIRAHFAEQVRGMIFACRKQLRSKSSSTKEASSAAGGGEHGQRHLNAMVELLGQCLSLHFTHHTALPCTQHSTALHCTTPHSHASHCTACLLD